MNNFGQHWRCTECGNWNKIKLNTFKDKTKFGIWGGGSGLVAGQAMDQPAVVAVCFVLLFISMIEIFSGKSSGELDETSQRCSRCGSQK